MSVNAKHWQDFVWIFFLINAFCLKKKEKKKKKMVNPFAQDKCFLIPLTNFKIWNFYKSLSWANGSHRFPLYYLTVVEGLREAWNLLERFRSKSYDFNTQFTHVSRHPGTYSMKPKLKFRKNCLNKKVSDSWEKNTDTLPLKTLQKNITKKYQKHEIVHNLWRIQRPQQSILSNIWGHFLIVNLSLPFLFCFCHKTPDGLEIWINKA